jgi:hypothetical protein
MPPRLGPVLREAISDFYYNSWRFGPANVIWTALFVAIVVAAATWSPAIGLVPLLALPTAGLARMAAIVARGEAVTFSDFRQGMTRAWRPAMLVGVGATALAAILTTNTVLGLGLGGPFGWAFSAFALYADVGLTMILVAFWPLLGDPAREGRSVTEHLKLAALVNLARPGRMAGMTILLAAFLVASTVLFAALVTVSIAYATLVATRYVLPLADRIEGRADAGPKA